MTPERLAECDARLAVLLGSYRDCDELRARHADAWKIGEELIRQRAITRNFHARDLEDCGTCFDFHQKQFHDFAREVLPDLLTALREAHKERDALQRRMEAWEKVFRGL